MKEHVVLSAWRRSGIRPLDPEVFTEEDFAPSYASSIKPQLPVPLYGLANSPKVPRPSGDREDENGNEINSDGESDGGVMDPDLSGSNVAHGNLPSSTPHLAISPGDLPLSAQSTTPPLLSQPPRTNDSESETSRVLHEEGRREPPNQPGTEGSSNRYTVGIVQCYAYATRYIVKISTI
ncbi:hypothetical protein EDB85DRAFT_1899036 [Lactarius pseudohatsudake]|nr:hypothetical protein EDB85DRAFT_1899036 [Lactarius pseudohatsudake]